MEIPEGETEENEEDTIIRKNSSELSRNDERHKSSDPGNTTVLKQNTQKELNTQIDHCKISEHERALRSNPQKNTEYHKIMAIRLKSDFLAIIRGVRSRWENFFTMISLELSV